MNAWQGLFLNLDQKLLKKKNSKFHFTLIPEKSKLFITSHDNQNKCNKRVSFTSRYTCEM